jgi:hypothetical protein
MESILIILAIAIWWTVRDNKKKAKRKVRNLDDEYRELIQTHLQTIESGNAIKNYLLQVLADCQNDRAKFSEPSLKRAGELFEMAGPGGYYWLAEIAAQFVLLSAAQINQIPTSVDLALKAPVTPEQLVNEVVRVR